MANVLPHQELRAMQGQVHRSHEDDNERARATQRANKAFRKLNVVRPACECLSTKKVEMHHPDYEKWWLVGFLCQRCHVAEHWGRLERPYRLYDLREQFT